MPKIIKDLEKRIIDCATETFLEEDFQEIDIRKIAKKCGIAVGTVYNYFPNKTTIMHEVFQSLWEESLLRLDQMIEEAEPSRELFLQYAEALHGEMAKKKGIGMQLFRLELMEANDGKLVHEKLFHEKRIGLHRVSQMKRVIVKSFGLPSNGEALDGFNQLVSTSVLLLMTGHSFADNYSEFVCDLVESYIQKNG